MAVQRVAHCPQNNYSASEFVPMNTSMLRRCIFCAVCAFCALTTRSVAEDKAALLRVENATQYVIVGIYAATAEQETWGESRLDGQHIQPGASFEFELAAAFHWLMAEVDVDGAQVRVEDEGDFTAGATYLWSISEERFHMFDEEGTYGYFEDTYGYFDDSYGYFEDTYGYLEDTYGYLEHTYGYLEETYGYLDASHPADK